MGDRSEHGAQRGRVPDHGVQGRPVRETGARGGSVRAAGRLAPAQTGVGGDRADGAPDQPASDTVVAAPSCPACAYAEGLLGATASDHFAAGVACAISALVVDQGGAALVIECGDVAISPDRGDARTEFPFRFCREHRAIVRAQWRTS